MSASRPDRFNSQGKRLSYAFNMTMVVPEEVLTFVKTENILPLLRIKHRIVLPTV